MVLYFTHFYIGLSLKLCYTITINRKGSDADHTKNAHTSSRKGGALPMIDYTIVDGYYITTINGRRMEFESLDALIDYIRQD